MGGILSQSICTSSHHIVYVKYSTILNWTPIKLHKYLSNVWFHIIQKGNKYVFILKSYNLKTSMYFHLNISLPQARFKSKCQMENFSFHGVIINLHTGHKFISTSRNGGFPAISVNKGCHSHQPLQSPLKCITKE